jgi:iron complex outermembrane receptor protein
MGITFLLGLKQNGFQDITNHETNNECYKKIGITASGYPYAINNKRINVYTTYLEGYQYNRIRISLMPQTGSLKEKVCIPR